MSFGWKSIWHLYPSFPSSPSISVGLCCLWCHIKAKLPATTRLDSEKKNKKKNPWLNNRRSDRNGLTRRCIKREADEWLEIIRSKHRTNMFSSLPAWLRFWQGFLKKKKKKFTDITIRLQSSPGCSHSKISAFVFPKPNTRLLCDVLFCLTDSLFPPVVAAKRTCEVARRSGLPGVYFPCLPNLQTTAASPYNSLEGCAR